MKRKYLIICCSLLLVVCCACFLTSCSGSDEDVPGDEPSQTEKSAGEPAEETPKESAEESEPAEDPDTPLSTVFFASDYQPEEGWPAPRKTFRGILEAAKRDGMDPNGMVICGDYTESRVEHDYQTEPDAQIKQIRKTARKVFPGLKNENMIFTQGNHDTLTKAITPTGLYEYDDYLVYVLNTQYDFPWKQGKVAGSLKRVKRSSKKMKKCFDKLIERGETRPVFIAGHVPLHFTSKTSTRHTTGDNLYSRLIFDVVNEAAESLDIIYFFGHNHSKGWDCYLGGSSVYKAIGDQILIPIYTETQRASDDYSHETLNFTYLNTGYLGFYMNCGFEEQDAGLVPEYAAADGTLTGTVCQIYPEKVVLTRYSASGVHPIGWKGEADPYDDYIDVGLIDEADYSQEIVNSPQTVVRRSR